MAKLHQGILDGFSGTVGTVIGYRRNNQWFMRAKPRFVANPRTEAQQAHRRQFGDMVSLASKLLPVLKVGLRHYASQHAMTAGNAFVHLNWVRDRAISLKDMKVSVGPVPMVTFTEISLEDGVLTLKWDKNLHDHGAKNEDTIKIFAYNAEKGLTQCVATAERRSRRLSVLLPDAFCDAHLWAILEDPMGRTSSSKYLEILEPSSTTGLDSASNSFSISSTSSPTNITDSFSPSASAPSADSQHSLPLIE